MSLPRRYGPRQRPAGSTASERKWGEHDSRVCDGCGKTLTLNMTFEAGQVYDKRGRRRAVSRCGECVPRAVMSIERGGAR